jgi:hypothetical protein
MKPAGRDAFRSFRCAGRRLVLAIAAGVSSTQPVLALCPYPTPKVCSAYFSADAVFVATALTHGFIGDDDAIRHRMKVSRVFKGEVGPIAIVYSDLGSASLQFTDGQEYVVFARKLGGRLKVGCTCGPLDESDNVAETVRHIEALSDETSAAIEGEVLQYPTDGPGIAGVLVKVRSTKQTFEARSDARGYFSVRVPRGVYEVTIDSAYEASDYGRTDLRAIDVVAGQCAQIQFVRRRGTSPP